jgi:hypothetical protein
VKFNGQIDLLRPVDAHQQKEFAADPDESNDGEAFCHAFATIQAI